jgi:hypothetical protein
MEAYSQMDLPSQMELPSRMDVPSRMAAFSRMDGLRPLALRSQLDAINLMLRDLGIADQSLAHRAAFRGCTRELVDLRGELIAYLRERRERLRSPDRG